MKIYTGDLLPPLKITLKDSEVDVNLDQATSVRVLGRRNGELIFDRTGDDISWVHDGAISVVTMPWQAGDTDEAGMIEPEVEVTWPGPKPQTFRPPTAVHVAATLDA